MIRPLMPFDTHAAVKIRPQAVGGDRAALGPAPAW